PTRRSSDLAYGLEDTNSSSTVVPLVHAVGLVMLPPAGFVFCVIYLALRWIKSNELREPRTVVYSESGIREEGATFAFAVNWDKIKTAQRRGRMVVLLDERRANYGAPRSAFSDTDWERFRKLVEARVPASSLQ